MDLRSRLQSMSPLDRQRLLVRLSAPKPPPLRPHVLPKTPPPVTIGDPDPEREADPRIGRVADHFRLEALRQGKAPWQAAQIARSQALNYIYKLGIYKPPPDPSEY